jgi:hypothetical protein
MHAPAAAALMDSPSAAGGSKGISGTDATIRSDHAAPAFSDGANPQPVLTLRRHGSESSNAAWSGDIKATGEKEPQMNTD